MSPLTDDAANIELFVDALSPEVMPDDGQRAERAIRESVLLLKRAGFTRGDILLMTHRTGAGARNAAAEARTAGFRVSVLGLGTAEGGSYVDRRGQRQRTWLDVDGLRAAADAGDGRFVAASVDDSDLRALGVLRADRVEDAVASDRKRGALAIDEGFWLLPPLLLLALFAFRRGVLAVALLTLCLPWQVVRADEGTLWQRRDQVEHARLQQGVEAYRSGDYKSAMSHWADLPGADAAYNRGNALVRQGRYDEAIAEYDRALRLQPGMADAADNRHVAAVAREQRAQQQAQRKPDPSGGSSKDQGGQQGKDQQGKDQQGKDQQGKDQQGQGSAGQGSTGQGSAGQGSTGQGSAGQGSAGQGSAGQGSAGQRSAGQDRAGRQSPGGHPAVLARDRNTPEACTGRPDDAGADPRAGRVAPVQSAHAGGCRRAAPGRCRAARTHAACAGRDPASGPAGRSAAPRHGAQRRSRPRWATSGQRGLAAPRPRRPGRPAAREVQARRAPPSPRGRPLMRRASAHRAALASRLAAMALLCLALAWTTAAQAQVRAWLEPDRIALDETTELSIEIDGMTADGLPDLSMLSQDFRMLDQGVAQQVDLSNGQLNLRIIMRMRLQPRREGVLQVPILRVGNSTTPPLRLVVGPPKTPVPKVVAPDDPALNAQPLFLESKLDTPSPYVQQTVGYTVRLYYESGSLIDGRLDQDAPDGASLQQLGEDAQHTLRVKRPFLQGRWSAATS